MEANTEKPKNLKESVKSFLQEEVLRLQPPSTIPSIYKVPAELRNGHTKFFEPVSVTIGPLHYHEEGPAQKLKKWCLKNFIARLDDHEEESLDELVERLSGSVQEIRECYEDIDGRKDEELVKIMLLDGCFILEQFWSLDERHSQGNDPYGNTLETIPFLTLQQDLLKIENQLPFFVLKTLATLATEKIKENNNLESSKGSKEVEEEENYNVDMDPIRSALNFFNISKPAIDDFLKQKNEARHLLELIMNVLFRNTTAGTTPVNMPLPPDHHENPLTDAKSASELEYYGIKVRGDESKNIANVRFSSSSRELRIPKLNIREATLWNFLIFETLSCVSRTISSYVVLMGTLIVNEKDVEVLLGSKVLVSHGNDTKSLLAMFTDMAATVNMKKNFCFAGVMNQLRGYWGSRPRRLRAYVVRRCYDSRWELLNNVLLFILTFTQSLFSVLGYNPKQKI